MVDPEEQLGPKRPPAYASPAMQARRTRLLDETLFLLRSEGLADFRLNRLSECAGVAINTIYRTFGSREALIATALEERLLGRIEAMPAGSSWTLDDNLARIVDLVDFFGPRRADLQALTALHFSPAASAELRARTEAVFREPNARWVAGLDPVADLQPDVDPAELIADLVSIELAILHDWAFGRIADAHMPARMLRAWLGLTVAATSGRVAAEAKRALRELAEAA